MTGNRTTRRTIYILCGYILAIGFTVNLIWENAKAPFYKGYDGFFQHFGVCLVAAVVDALVLLLLYFLVAAFNHNLYWPLKVKLWQYGLLAFIGGVLAVWFEKWALAGEQWSYTNEMPVVPVLDVGLLPLLQLMLLPGLTFYLSARATKLYLRRGQ